MPAVFRSPAVTDRVSRLGVDESLWLANTRKFASPLRVGWIPSGEERRRHTFTRCARRVEAEVSQPESNVLKIVRASVEEVLEPPVPDQRPSATGDPDVSLCHGQRGDPSRDHFGVEPVQDVIHRSLLPSKASEVSTEGDSLPPLV